MSEEGEELLGQQADQRETEEWSFTAAEEPYQYSLREAETFVNDAKLADYSTHWFPLVYVSVVCFPEQQTPDVFNGQDEQYQRVTEAAKGNGFVALITSLVSECHKPPFVATVCKVLRASNSRRSVLFQGANRCEVIEINEENYEAKVRILPDIELPPILPRVLRNNWNKMGQLSEYQKICLGSRISGFPIDLVRGVTQLNIAKCMKQLKEIYEEEEVDAALAKGLTYFSYFVAGKLDVNSETEYKILKENSADARIAMAVDYLGNVQGVCSQCHNPVAESYQIYNPKKGQLTHTNEYGHCHRITLLTHLKDFNVTTLPSFTYTWFEGYAWEILTCLHCDNHLGWRYSSTVHQPRVFFGVTREGVNFPHYQRMLKRRLL